MTIIEKASKKEIRRDNGSILRGFDLPYFSSRLLRAMRAAHVPEVLMKVPIPIDHASRLATSCVLQCPEQASAEGGRARCDERNVIAQARAIPPSFLPRLAKSELERTRRFGGRCVHGLPCHTSCERT